MKNEKKFYSIDTMNRLLVFNDVELKKIKQSSEKHNELFIQVCKAFNYLAQKNFKIPYEIKYNLVDYATMYNLQFPKDVNVYKHEKQLFDNIFNNYKRYMYSISHTTKINFTIVGDMYILDLVDDNTFLNNYYSSLLFRVEYKKNDINNNLSPDQFIKCYAKRFRPFDKQTEKDLLYFLEYYEKYK